MNEWSAVGMLCNWNIPGKVKDKCIELQLGYLYRMEVNVGHLRCNLSTG